ncbi:hypothetical protein [Microscilla marina]|uniref:hypothetical protein n=1 Tax=Microscilla marina TaxID=1027 RepID=UPI0012F86C86|nr:hypothetical protein [Microscilla marina]
MQFKTSQNQFVFVKLTQEEACKLQSVLTKLLSGELHQGFTLELANGLKKSISANSKRYLTVKDWEKKEKQ